MNEIMIKGSIYNKIFNKKIFITLNNNQISILNKNKS